MRKYTPGVALNSGKVHILLEIIDETVRVGDRILVFSQSLITLNLLEEFFSQRNIFGTEQRWKRNVSYYRECSWTLLVKMCVFFFRLGLQ